MTDATPAARGSGSGGLDLRIARRAFQRFQFGAVTLLIALGTFHYVYAGMFGEDFIMKFTKIFDVDQENSIPTVFSIFNLMISSLLLFAIWLDSKERKEPIAVYWLGLSIIFLGLSVDEGAALHERAAGLRLLRSWLSYGVLFSLAVFLTYIPFLRRIDRRTAALFVFCGAIFVSGAVGLEYFGGWKARNETDFFNQALRILEEALEMYGIALFNCTLFGHIMSKNIIVTLGCKPRTPDR